MGVVFPDQRESEPGGLEHRRRSRWWLLVAGALVAIATGVFVLSPQRLPPQQLPPQQEENPDRETQADIAASPGRVGTPTAPETAKLPPAPPVVSERPPREPFFTDPSALPSSVAEVIEEADRVMARMISDLPDLPDSLELRARFFNWRGEKAEAVRDWERCLELDPAYGHAYLGLARVAAAQGRHAESAELYRKALEISSSFEQARTELARVLIQLGQATDAIALLEQQTGRQSSVGHFLLGQAYAQQQDFEKACQHYQTATSVRPDYPDAFYGWATALARLGRRDEARQAMTRFRELDKEHLQEYRLERKEFDDREAACGDIAEMYANIGTLYLTRGRAEAAEELWHRAAKIAPQNVASRQGLAWLYRQSGKIQDTIAVMRELAEMSPAPLVYWVEIGRLQTERGDFDAAESAFQQACAADPEAADGYASLAQLYLQTNRKLDEAVELVEKAVQQSAAAEMYYLQAMILEKRGDLPGARSALERAAQKAPDNPVYRQTLQEWSGSDEPRPDQAGFPVRLDDVTQEAGIHFVHTDGGSGRRYIVETVSAGLALFDYDADGLIDIYFLNGAPLLGTEVDVAPRNALYRNLGDFHFIDVTEQAGVGDTGYGLGVAVGDFDHDGDGDLYLNNYGPNVFYRNNGDGTFTDITPQTGTLVGDYVGAGAAFLDADSDGDLDLFVANYLEFSFDAVGPLQWQGVPVYPQPEKFPPAPDCFFRNNGDGTFTDSSAQAGILCDAGRSMGICCADYDNDGHVDIFVNNDGTRDYLFRNDGHGRFHEVGTVSGTGYDSNGSPMGSMGVTAADYDNDGWLDFHVTSYQRQWATLYRNLGDGLFQDVTQSTEAGSGTYPYVTWGADLVDFDNDGDRDLFVATGHLMDLVEEYDDTTAYESANVLLLNDGQGRFSDVTAQAGDGMRVVRSSRGTGFDDLDNDGDVDVVILNSRREPTVLRNQSAAHHWLQIELHGVRANRDAIGARVHVVAGDRSQIAEVQPGRGYQSSYGRRLYFGLGDAERVDRIEIHWPGQGQDVVTDIPTNRRISIVEGGLVLSR